MVQNLTFVRGPAGQSLGLNGYGLLRAPNLGLGTPPLALANSLAHAIDSVSGYSNAETSHIAAQLRDSEKQSRKEGMQRLVRLFSEEPGIREGLLRNIAADPIASKSLNAWNDPMWMGRVDSMMGFIESVSEIDMETLAKIRAWMPSWTSNFSSSESAKSSAQRILEETFLPLLKKAICKETIADDRRFKELLPLLFAYRSAVSFSFRSWTGKPGLVKMAAMFFRALRRMEMTSGVARDVTEKYEQRIFELPDHLDGKYNLPYMNEEAFDTYKEMLALTPPQDPLVPLKNDGIGEFLDKRLARWIRQSFKIRTYHGSLWRDMEDIIKRRVEAIESGLWAEFAATLFGANFNRSDLPQDIADELTRSISIPKVRTHRIFSRNPYEIKGEEGTVFHMGLGRGTVEDEPDSNGMVQVRFYERNHTIKVLESTLVPIDDEERFLKAIEARTSHFSYLATYFAAAALHNYLAADDPARKNLDGFSMGTLRDTILRERKPSERTAVDKNILSAGRLLGFDPAAWSMLLCYGIDPHEIFTKGKKSESMSKKIELRMRPEMLNALQRIRPWQASWKMADSEAIRTAGHYYPTYYRGPREKDLTGLYFDYREGSASAFMKTAELMQPLVDLWAQAPHRSAEVLLMPMIGTAPNERLSKHLGRPSHFPWLPRPADYGEGVEGRTLFQKMQILSQALRINPAETAQIEGRSVLLLDDNVTDNATWMTARRLLFEAGAAEVGLVALTDTIRHPEDHHWVLR